jgi:glycosyltransferase involved in cell wall biosynthesis
MLKILFLCPYLPHIGVHAGAGRMFNLIVRLSQKYKISVLSYLEGEEERQYIPELEKYCQKVRVISRQGDFSLSNFSPKFPFYQFFSEQMQKELLDMLEENNFDILQIEYLQMAHYIYFTATFPVVLTIHELISKRLFDFFKYEKSLFKKLKILFKYFLHLNFEINICKRFDAVITLTERERRNLKSFCPKTNTFVAPMGVDIFYFKPKSIREESNSLLYVGYFGHYPNVDAVLYFYKDILPLVKREIPNIKLYIVGAFPTSEIFTLANGNIFVTGRVDDLRPYYDMACVFIAPIRLGGGMRGKILEAWAMQKPVVSTPLATAGIEAIDGKNIFIANTKKDFAKKIIMLLRNEGLRKKIGFEGRKTVEEKFDWDKIAYNLDGIYQKLVDGNAKE